MAVNRTHSRGITENAKVFYSKYHITIVEFKPWMTPAWLSTINSSIRLGVCGMVFVVCKCLVAIVEFKPCCSFVTWSCIVMKRILRNDTDMVINHKLLHNIGCLCHGFCCREEETPVSSSSGSAARSASHVLLHSGTFTSRQIKLKQLGSWLLIKS